MSTLRVAPEVWNELRADLLSTPHLERAAVGFAGVRGGGRKPELLLRDWIPLAPEDYLVQLGHHLEVSGSVWARAAKRARESHEAIVIFHSHPRDSKRPQFSVSDDYGEELVVPKLQARAAVPVAAAVLAPGGERARLHMPGASGPIEASVERVGERGGTLPAAQSERFDRQVRALTREGQGAIGALSVGVVGAGGLGSHVVQQLLHLGVGGLLVIDPDTVAVSNLSRLVGAGRRDARRRRPKVRLARRLARRLGSTTRLSLIQGSITDGEIGRHLLDCDIVIGCTDNQWSRTLLNQLAYQFYLPVLDLGVELQPGGAMGGRVSWLAPGSACLWCAGILDAATVRTEQLPPELAAAERERGYIAGVEEPAPAVVSINGVIASVAVTELLARWTGFAGTRSRADLLLYRLADGSLRRISPNPSSECPTCGPEGLIGSGDLTTPPW
ncbi:MAG TPA: ThiF family adenylyltransferase [Solirubrobacterales bacterium]